MTLPSGPLVFEARTVDRLPRGRGGRHGGVGHQPGSPGRAHRPGGRRLRSAERGRDLAPPPLHLGHRHHPGSAWSALAVGLTAPAIALVGPRGGPDLHRRGPAGAGCRPADGQRDRAPAGPAVRHVGPAGPGELHAQPAPHGADGVGSHGRVWPWSRPSRCSVRRSPGPPRAAWTTPSAPISSSPTPNNAQGGFSNAVGPTAAGGRRASPRRRRCTRTSSRSRGRSRTSPPCRRRDLSDTVILNMTRGIVVDAGRRPVADRHHDGQLEASRGR